MYPKFRIQFHRFLTQLEMQNRFSFRISMDFSQHITGTYQATFLNTYSRQVTINGNITSMTYQHISQANVLEDSRHLTIKNSTGIGSRLSFDIHSLIIQFHITKPLHLILSIMSHHHIWSGNWHGKNTFIFLKAT